MFERFTGNARQLTIGAQQIARETHADRIEAVHLLLAVFDGADTATIDRLHAVGLTAARLREAAVGGPDGDADDSRLLGAIGIDVDRIRRAIDGRFGDGAFDAAGTGDRSSRRRGHIPFAKGAKKSLELSLREALRLKDNRIDTAHVVLGILRTDDPTIERLLDDDAQWDLRRGLEEDLRRAA